jgi:CRISPR-associated endoribonuclease Cas6
LALMELASFVLTLRPQYPLESLPHVGRAAHGLLLAAVAQTDPALAEALHSGSELRPFTASDLYGPGRRQPLTPQQTFSLRLTTLHEPVTRAVLAAAQSSAGLLAPEATVELAGSRFNIEKADWGQGPEHPWARATTFEALSAPWLLGRRKPSTRFNLLFASPTTFKSAGKHMPVPMPNWVFRSLLEKWNQFAPVALPPETQRFADECLAFTAYRLKTQMLPLKEGGLRAGAVGLVRYTALNADRYWLSVLHLLADFALFAGVGAGTGWGLGQCRKLEESTAPDARRPHDSTPPT